MWEDDDSSLNRLDKIELWFEERVDECRLLETLSVQALAVMCRSTAVLQSIRSRVIEA